MDSSQRRFSDRLPQVIEKNAQAMMKRIVARMRDQIETSRRPDDVSHGLLFLKVGEAELVDGFLAAARAKLAADSDELVGLSLEPAEGKASDADFRAADAAFEQLKATAQARGGAGGLDRFGREPFLAALLDAFHRSRMDERATSELMPFARSALDTELQAFYTQLDALLARAPGA